jgi:lipopolysaccharide export system permease protein
MQAFLEANALDAGPYTEALWERVLFPVNVLAMVLIGLPFALGGVFRQSPRGGLGLNVFVGIGLGLVFFVLSRLVQGVVTLWPIPIWLGSLLPAVLISALALVLLARR